MSNPEASTKAPSGAPTLAAALVRVLLGFVLLITFAMGLAWLGG